MKKEEFDKIKKENDLKKYIESYGIKIQNNMFLCPFHQDHNPSANIYEKDGKQLWKCFACGVGGDVIEFASKYNNCSKSESIQYFNLEDKANLFKPINSLTSPNRINTLKSNLKDKIKKEGIGFLKEFFPKIELSNEEIFEHLGWDTYNDSLTIIINDKTIKTHHKKGKTGKWLTSKGSTSANPYPLSIFENSNKTITFVCEGEKDATNLYLNGITAITLGGALFDWTEHKDIFFGCNLIILVFDNDDAGIKGRDKTIKALASLNIPMKYIDFSKLPVPVKKGYDASDFLLEHSPSELLSNQICFEVNFEKTLKTELEKELSRLNINVYYDENKRQYVIIDNKTNRILHYGNKQQIHQILSSMTKRIIKPNEYSEFPLCHAYYDPSYKIPTLKPNVKPINVYQKAIFSLNSNPINCIPQKITILLDNLFEVKEQLYYFLNWLACFLQTGEKSQTSIVLISGQGVGKGTLAKIIEKLFGEDNFIEVTNTMIESDFNDFMLQKQLVNMNEINTVNDSSSRKHMKNKLKSLITDPSIRINPKGLTPFNVKNTFNIIFTTNEPHPIDVEEDDRRFTIIKSNGFPIKDVLGEDFTEFWPKISKEIPDFHQYLMSYKCDFKKYNTPLETEYKIKLKGMSQTFDDRFALAVAKNNFSFFEELLPDTLKIEDRIYDKVVAIQEYKACVNKEFISNEFLCSLYRGIKGVDFRNQLIKGRLSATGIFDTYRIEDIQINLNGKTTRGIKTRNEI